MPDRGDDNKKGKRGQSSDFEVVDPSKMTEEEWSAALDEWDQTLAGLQESKSGPADDARPAIEGATVSDEGDSVEGGRPGTVHSELLDSGEQTGSMESIDGESDGLDLPDVDGALDDLLRDSQSLSPLLDGQDAVRSAPGASSEGATRIASVEDILVQAGPLAREDGGEAEEAPFLDEATRIAGPELGMVVAGSARDDVQDDADLEPDDFYDDIVVAVDDEDPKDAQRDGQVPSHGLPSSDVGAQVAPADAELVWTADEISADEIGALDGVASKDLEEAVEELAAVAPGTFGDEPVKATASVAPVEEEPVPRDEMPESPMSPLDEVPPVPSMDQSEVAESPKSLGEDGETGDAEAGVEREAGQEVDEVGSEEKTARSENAAVADASSDSARAVGEMPQREDSPGEPAGPTGSDRVDEEGETAPASEDGMGEESSDLGAVFVGRDSDEAGLGILDDLVGGEEPSISAQDVLSSLSGMDGMEPMLADVLAVGFVLGEIQGEHRLDGAEDRSFEPEPMSPPFHREAREFETPRVEPMEVEAQLDPEWLQGLAEALERDAAVCEDEETMARRVTAAGFVYDAGLDRPEQALGRFMDALSRGVSFVECLWSAAGDAFRVGDWDTFRSIHEKASDVLVGSDAVVMGGIAAELALHMDEGDRAREIFTQMSSERAGRLWSLLATQDAAVADGRIQDAAVGLVQLGAEATSERDGGELLLIGADLLRVSSSFTDAVDAYDKALQAEGDDVIRALAHRGKMWCSAAEDRWDEVAEELGRLAAMVVDGLRVGLCRRQIEIYWRRLHDADKALGILTGLDEEAQNELVDIQADALVKQGRHDEAAEVCRRAAGALADPLRRVELLLLGGRIAESSVGAQSLSGKLYREVLSEFPEASAAELGLWRRLLASEADRSPGRELLRWVADVSGMRKDVILSWLAREHRLAGENDVARSILSDAVSLEGGPSLYALLEAVLEDAGRNEVGKAFLSPPATGVDDAMRAWLATVVDASLDRLLQLAVTEPWSALWPLRHMGLLGGEEKATAWEAFLSLQDRLGGDVAEWSALRRMVEAPLEDSAGKSNWPGAFLQVSHEQADSVGETSPWSALVEAEQDETARILASWLDAAWAELFSETRDRIVEGYQRASELGLGPLRGLDRVLLAEGLGDRIEAILSRKSSSEADPVTYALAALSGRLDEASQAAKRLSENDDTGLWLAEWESLQQDLGAWPTLASDAIARLQHLEEVGDVEAKIRAYEQLVWVDRDGRGEESSAMLGYASLLQLDPSHQRARRALELYYASDGRLEDLASVYEVGSQSEDLPPVERVAILVRLFGLRRRLGHINEAVDAARRLVELDPARLGAQLFLESRARLKTDMDLFSATWGALADQLDSHPVSRAAALCRAGEARLEQGLVEDARAFLAAAAGAEPSNLVPGAVWLRLGLMHEQWEDVASAAEALARAAVVVDVRADALLLAGVVCEDRLSDDDRAEAAYRDCLQARPGDFDAYARLADLLRRKQDFEHLAEVIEDRLAVEQSPVVKVDLLWDLARLWRDRLDSPARAIEFLEALLALKPDFQAALSAVADLYESEGRFEEVAEILTRMCRLERDPEVLQGLLYRLGSVFEEQLGDERKAAAVFSQAISVNPRHLEALDRLAAIHEHLGEWKAALSVSGRILKVVTDPARQVQEYIRLARILEHGYKDMRRAQEALRRAVAATPEDLTAIGELASFYARRGDMSSLLVHLDQAASVMRDGLDRDALDVERYRGLVQIFKWRRSGGRAARAAEVLDLFGLAGPDELALLTEHPVRPVDPKLLVGAEVDDVLFGTALPSSLRQIFRILGPGLAKQYAGGLRGYGLSRSTRISTGDAVGVLASDLAGALGVSHFELHRSPTKKRTWAVEPGDPPILVLGEELLDELDEAAIEFLVLRYLKLVQTGLVVPAKIPAEETAVLVAAVIRQYVSDYDILGLDPKLLIDRTKLVGKVIPRRSRDELMPYAYECSSTNLDFSEARIAVMRGADRAALMGTGRVGPAVQALAAIQGIRLEGPPEARISALQSADEIQDLIRFAVSEEAFSLASQLGVGGL